jgi:hypothetical protein
MNVDSNREFKNAVAVTPAILIVLVVCAFLIDYIDGWAIAGMIVFGLLAFAVTIYRCEWIE